VRKSLQSRRATAADAQLLLPLYESVDLDELGYVDISLADTDAMLRDPRALLDKSVLVTRADGAPVAVMVPSRAARDRRIDLELLVEPGRPALFEQLVAAAEKEWTDAGSSPTLELWVASSTARALLERRGYVTTATFVRYSRGLSAHDTRPADRSDARVRPVAGESEWPLYHETLQRVFSDASEPPVESFREWAERMQSADVNDPAQWWLLEVRAAGSQWEAAGLLQGNRQDMAVEGAWIKNFGLVPEHRGRGLGRYLLLWGLAELAAAGWQRVGLGADLGNVTSALALYDSLGFERMYTANRLSKQL
jgi:GNAT superfamily N-acetyltransferase